MIVLNDLVSEYLAVLRLGAPPKCSSLTAEIARFLDAMAGVQPLPEIERRARLLALVNRKFDINKDRLDALYSRCAAGKITFNYREKERISEAFDISDSNMFRRVLDSKGVTENYFYDLFAPASEEATLSHLHSEIKKPTLVRSDSKPRDWSEEIKESLLGGFAFSAFPIEAAHRFFDPWHEDEIYEENFWRHLHRAKGGMFSREKSLTYLPIRHDTDIEKICAAIANEFRSLCNHGHLAIHIENWNGKSARLAGFLTVFSEKFYRTHISSAFFKWKDIESSTKSYIPLNPNKDYKFNTADLGFQYRDTFVFEGNKSADALIIMQKNVADETCIPCPACRSHNVQGNSYPSIGVRSWECKNPLCPDRSKFGRGKRYSFLQLLKQEAIEVDENTIPREMVRIWARDVQPLERSKDALSMLIQHYSIAGDGILIVGSTEPVPNHRNVRRVAVDDYFASIDSSKNLVSEFMNGPLWSRCAVPVTASCVKPARSVQVGKCTALMGDSNEILYSLKESSIDGAVTSPPYYNAREYSQWNNIYCYMFDMFNNARGVYRALRPGGYYLFNIFDYFDNENSIALSAMGQKRMILSAYCVVLFETAGFRCVGSIAWDKGDIEGKRGFNGGNFSPYYQAPFNCWEHILVFRKPGSDVALLDNLPPVLRAKPVIKMVRGENRHGHTAPFPEALPRLLLDRLPTTAVVLDPYGGSMTTGVAASRTGHASICIEQSAEYFDLGLSMLHRANQQSRLI